MAVTSQHSSGPSWSAALKARDKLRSYVEASIGEAVAGTAPPSVVRDLVQKAGANVDAHEREVIRDQLMLLLFAGSDTTASAATTLLQVYYCNASVQFGLALIQRSSCFRWFNYNASRVVLKKPLLELCSFYTLSSILMARDSNSHGVCG